MEELDSRYERDDRGDELQGVARLSPRGRARIEKTPGDEGWHHEDNMIAYLSLAEKLLDAGLSEDHAVDVLNAAYWAAADEYGA